MVGFFISMRGNFNKGKDAGNYKHGDYGSLEYKAWECMKKRVKREHYIKKGIKVCDEWMNDYSQFLSDMGKKPTPNHSLDRVDNSKGYSPDNCRWATKSEQQQNKGNNNNVCINGEVICLSEYSRRTGVNINTLRERKKRGIPDEKLHIRQRKSKRNTL